MPRGGSRPGPGRKPRQKPVSGDAPAQSLSEAKRNVRRRKRAELLRKPASAEAAVVAVVTREARVDIFVQEYLVDFNGKRAYIAAGFESRGHVAETNASKLLRSDQVRTKL